MFIAETKLGELLVGVIVEHALNVPPPKKLVVDDPPQLYVVYEPPGALKVISHS
jgi:hypothetical protein